MSEAITKALQDVIAAHDHSLAIMGEQMRDAGVTALTIGGPEGDAALKMFEAISAARAALSKPAPSPQPAVPVVSPEQIEDLAWLDVDEHGEIDRSSDHNKMMTAPQRCAFKRGARAILTLRPAVEPMTNEQREVLAALVVGACEHKTRTLLALRAIEATEAQYDIGITAKAEGGEKP